MVRTELPTLLWPRSARPVPTAVARQDQHPTFQMTQQEAEDLAGGPPQEVHWGQSFTCDLGGGLRAAHRSRGHCPSQIDRGLGVSALSPAGGLRTPPTGRASSTGQREAGRAGRLHTRCRGWARSSAESRVAVASGLSVFTYRRAREAERSSACSSSDWPKLGAGNSVQVSHVHGGTQSLEPSLRLPGSRSAGSWSPELELGTERSWLLRDAGI